MALSILSAPRSSPLSAMATAQDQAVRRLVVPGLLALGRLSPGRHRVATARGAPFAAAMGMVDRVHRDPAKRPPAAEAAGWAGFADYQFPMNRVRDRGGRGPAI